MSRKEAILSLREVLIKRRDALRKVLAENLSSMNGYGTQANGDVVDAALDAVHGEISSQLAEVESKELARVENALQRMREGQYGVCEDCEVSIPMARLMALPYATKCIRCQREAELHPPKQEKGGDWPELADPFDDDQYLSSDLLNEAEIPD